MKNDLEKQYIKSMGNFFLTLWLGWLGIHRFIKKDYKMGLVYLFTFGIFGIGWIIDVIKSIIDVMKKYKQYQNPGNIISNSSNANTTKPITKKLKKENIIEKLNTGESYQIENPSGSCIVYPNHMEILGGYSSIPTKIYYDENDLPNFNLDRADFECKGYYNALNIHYFKTPGSSYSSLEIVHFDESESANIEQLVQYLNKKVISRVQYAEEQKKKKESAEHERRFGKNRYSNTKFTFINDNTFLKYSYYDVEVKGTQYTDFDITQIPIDEDLKFEFEPTNEYDKNAIKVLCNKVVIGYVPKNSIQEMVKNYIEDDNKYVEAFVSKVNEDSKLIQMAIGFYKELTDEELKNIPHVDASLIKTTKKSEYDDRQENLSTVAEGDEVEIDYDFETETYIVTNLGSELGEINKNKSETLQEYEYDGKDFYSIILELNDDSDNISCKIRVFII